MKDFIDNTLEELSEYLRHQLYNYNSRETERVVSRLQAGFRSALEEAMTEGKKLEQADILELVEDLNNRGYEDRQIIQSVLNHIKFEELTNPNGADYTSDFGKD